MPQEMPRREFLKGSLLATAGGAMALSAAGGAETKPAAGSKPVEAPKSRQKLSDCPRGKIGKLEISRLIMGSNLITYYVHARDLRFVNNLTRKYNTEGKILETLAMAESHGINTIMTQADGTYIDILKTYRDKEGGKLQWVITPPGISSDADGDREKIHMLAMEGVSAMYIHGNHGDPLCEAGKKDWIARTLESIRMNDIPAGIAGHDLNVVKYCEENKLEPDFYVKTFHHHKYPTGPKPDQLTKPYAEIPGYWCKSPQDTIDTMKNVKKPWIAFKVMAAGAIPPASAFKFAYENGADFVLAGMFDFEIAEDVKLATEAAAAAAKRARPWCG